MTVKYILLLFGVFLFTACGTTVNVDYDKQTDFTSLESFTLMPSPELKTGDERLDSPLVDQRVRKAILATLKARGYQQDESNADFAVAYQLGVRKEIDSSRASMSVGVGTYGRRSAVGMTYGHPGYVESYERGILTIDVLKGTDKRLVWRGSSGRRLYDGRTPEKTDKEINAVVKEILDKFPPADK